jgi:acyl-coenzyme A thioesterase PaaI-like protein
MVTLAAREGHDAKVRRDGVERLALGLRELADAAAVTAVDRAALDEITGALALLTQRLRAETDDDAYSGLVIKPVDYSVPEMSMPLNPIVGRCNPSRPDVHLRYADGEVVGTATFSRRFVGPPGHVHGGISAMLADQIVAATGGAMRKKVVTKSITVRFLRAVPLDEELELWGVATPDGENLRARFTVIARGKIAVAGTGVLVPLRNFVARTDIQRG